MQLIVQVVIEANKEIHAINKVQNVLINDINMI